MAGKKTVLLVLSMALSARGEPDWPTLSRGIVRVVARKKPPEMGLGVVIEASTDWIRVVTASHVAEDGDGFAQEFLACFVSDKNLCYKAHILGNTSRQEKLDLAVVEVEPRDGDTGAPLALPQDIPKLTVRARSGLRITERVWTFGIVHGAWPIPVSNTVGALSFDGDPQQLLYSKGSTDDGFSGGPIFDDDGRIVGIHRGRQGDVQFSVAVKAESAMDVLTALGHRTPNLGLEEVPATSIRSTEINLPSNGIRAIASPAFVEKRSELVVSPKNQEWSPWHTIEIPIVPEGSVPESNPIVNITGDTNCQEPNLVQRTIGVHAVQFRLAQNPKPYSCVLSVRVLYHSRQ
jgi:S1-C subfamily serine protease